MKEASSLFHQAFVALEANSYTSWHLGSLGSFIKDSIDTIKQGDIQKSVDRINEAFELISSLDKAVSDAVACLVPSLSAWILRMREFYLSLTTPALSNISKSKALYDKLDFHSLFDPALLRSFQEEIKLVSASDLNKRIVSALKPIPPARTGASQFRSNVRKSRGRSLRPFRGFRTERGGRAKKRGSDKFKK